MTTAARPRRHPEPRPARLPVATPAGRRFFLTEQLLEARRGSWLPTNGAGPDEDVNLYLALRLDELARGVTDPRVVPGLAPLLAGPDPRLGRTERAAWYRANGDHRLLTLGLFDRGETCRRRPVPWSLTPGEARQRDLAVAAACYEAAARLLERGPDRGGAAAAVMAKLADRCEDYRHVLAALAVRRLGLGAKLSHGDLSALAPALAPATATAPATDDAGVVATLLGEAPADAADVVLDLALEYRRRPEAGLRARIERLAPLAGLDAGRLVSLAADRGRAA